MCVETPILKVQSPHHKQLQGKQESWISLYQKIYLYSFAIEPRMDASSNVQNHSRCIRIQRRYEHKANRWFTCTLHAYSSM